MKYKNLTEQNIPQANSIQIVTFNEIRIAIIILLHEMNLLKYSINNIAIKLFFWS